MGETGLLVVLGFAIVAFGAIYRIIEENLTSIAWVPAIACSLFVLARLFSWLGRNRPDDVQLGTVAPPIDVNRRYNASASSRASYPTPDREPRYDALRQDGSGFPRQS